MFWYENFRIDIFLFFSYLFFVWSFFPTQQIQCKFPFSYLNAHIWQYQIIRLRERLDQSIVRRKQFEQQTKMKRWMSERIYFPCFCFLDSFFVFSFRENLTITVTAYFSLYLRALRRAQSEITETPIFFQSSNSLLPFETAGWVWALS